MSNPVDRERKAFQESLKDTIKGRTTGPSRLFQTTKVRRNSYCMHGIKRKRCRSCKYQ